MHEMLYPGSDSIVSQAQNDCESSCHAPWMAVMLPALKAELMTEGIRDVYKICHMSFSYKSVDVV